MVRPAVVWSENTKHIPSMMPLVLTISLMREVISTISDASVSTENSVIPDMCSKRKRRAV